MTQENETQGVLKAYPNHREEGTEPRPEWKSRHLTPGPQLLFHGVLPPPEGHAICSGRCGPGGTPWEGRAPTRPRSLSPGLPLCLCVLRAQGPQLGTCLADNTVPGTRFPRWTGCRDLKTAWILSLPKAAEHVSQRTYMRSPSTNGRCKQPFRACPWRETLDSKKIQCENRPLSPNPPSCSWGGGISERVSEPGSGRLVL